MSETLFDKHGRVGDLNAIDEEVLQKNNGGPKFNSNNLSIRI